MWIKLIEAIGKNAVGTRMDVADDVARSYVAAGLAEEAKEPSFEESISAARTEFQGNLQTIVRSVHEDVQRAFEAARPRRPNVVAGVEVGGRIEGLDSPDGRSCGDLVRSLIFTASPDADEQTAAREKLFKPWAEGGYGVTRSMAEGGGASGGYITVPTTYETQMLQIAGEQSVLAGLCRQVGMSTRQVEWPALDQFQVPTAGQSAFYGGVKVYRKGESTQRTASNPSYSKVTLVCEDMTAYTEIPRDLVQDAAQLNAQVPTLMGEAIGWREDWELFNGSGAGQFLGFYNAPSTLSVTRNTASHIKYQDVFGMYKRLLPRSMKSAKLRWYAHPYTMDELLSIQDPSGKFIMLPYPMGGGEASLNAAPRFQMLGIEVVFTEKAAILGSTGDLSLVDGDGILLGRRSGLEIGLSEHFKFDTDQLAIRAKIRNDAQPWLKKAITLADGSSTVSVAIVLN